MDIKIKKRDGRVEDFDSEKIVRAVERAMDEDSLGIDHALAVRIACAIKNECASMDEAVDVERVQDMVEERLMASKRKDVARRYVIYRNNRAIHREINSNVFRKSILKTKAKNTENANANVDEASFGGRKQEASDIVQKEIALKCLMSPDVAAAHEEGWIYQHDLNSYAVGMHNCLFADVGKMLREGFSTRNGDVRSASSFSTACQLVAVIFQAQSQVQFGGVASAHIDFDLAPYVKKSFYKHYIDGLKYVEGLGDVLTNECRMGACEAGASINDSAFDVFPKAKAYAMDMLEREGKQAAQGLYHNLNTLESRAGSQVPFSSINFGRDTSPEGRLVTRWLLEASLDGIGKYHRTSIFPISIFQFKKGVNVDKGDPNYDLKQLALKSLSHRIYPNWANCNWSEAHEDDNNPDTFFSTMGCRTLIGYDRNGLGYQRVGRGNNVPITIILPKIGIEYGICRGKRDKPDLIGFTNTLEEILILTEKALVERYEYMASQSPKSAVFMYGNHTIAAGSVDDTDCREALKHNTLAIGYIGIAEMCKALFGENHVHSQEAYDFALATVKHISDFAKAAGERHGLNFSAYAAPAENLCHTALKSLRKQYGVIDGVTSNEWLTNSHHVPVWEKVSIYEKLKLEAPFCKYPSGGCITYVECESTFMNNTKAIESIIDYAFGELDIPYLAFNFPIDSCLDCGYQSEINDCCPKCGSKNIQRLRRVTGYLTTDYNNFNKGKIAEVEHRVKHTAYTTSEELIE